MKFSELDTNAPLEEGAFCHFKAIPERGGHLLYTGPGAGENGEWVDEDQTPTAVGAYVRGWNAPTVRKAKSKIARMQMTTKPQERDPDEEGMIVACALVIRFQGIENDDGSPMEATEDNKRKILYVDDLAQQVLDFAKDRSHFFGGTASD